MPELWRWAIGARMVLVARAADSVKAMVEIELCPSYQTAFDQFANLELEDACLGALERTTERSANHRLVLVWLG